MECYNTMYTIEHKIGTQALEEPNKPGAWGRIQDFKLGDVK